MLLFTGAVHLVGVTNGVLCCYHGIGERSVVICFILSRGRLGIVCVNSCMDCIPTLKDRDTKDFISLQFVNSVLVSNEFGLGWVRLG
jgi:hypothetical protein